MNFADVFVVLLAIAAAVGGYRLGFMTRLVSWVTLVAGLAVAVWVLPWALGRLDQPDQTLVLVVSMAVVFAGMFVGQAVGFALGARLRPSVRSPALASVDRVAGAAVGVGGVVVVVWLLLPLLTSSTGVVSSVVANSVVARTIANTLPDSPDTVQALRNLVGDAPFPEVFEALRPSPDLGPPPVETGIDANTARQVADSVVLVRAAGCDQMQNGTGFAVTGADGSVLLVTNAHVVAGADTVDVQRSDGRWIATSVVAFDPVRDLAVLASTDLNRPALELVEARRDDIGGVFGHPSGGPLRISPARVSGSLDARGRDIYGQPGANRSVLELASVLAPGDSGSPVVDPAGRALGVVFAIATDNADVAYALEVAEITAVVGGVQANAPVVTTGKCLS